jgi:hypothetical protein
MHLQAYKSVTLEEERAFWESTGLLDKLMEEAEHGVGGRGGPPGGGVPGTMKLRLNEPKSIVAELGMGSAVAVVQPCAAVGAKRGWRNSPWGGGGVGYLVAFSVRWVEASCHSCYFGTLKRSSIIMDLLFPLD